MAFLDGLDPWDTTFPSGLDPADSVLPAGLDPADRAFVAADMDLPEWDRAVAASERASAVVEGPVADSVAVAALVVASLVSA